MSLTSFFTIVCFEIDVLVCILFPVQFSKIMCTSAVLIYITKSFPSCKPLFLKKIKKRKEGQKKNLFPPLSWNNLYIKFYFRCSIY